MKTEGKVMKSQGMVLKSQGRVVKSEGKVVKNYSLPKWWFFRCLLVEVVVFSLIFALKSCVFSLIVRRIGGCFVDLSSKWWFFH